MVRTALLALAVAISAAATNAPHSASCTIHHDPVDQELEITVRMDRTDLNNALELVTGQEPLLGDANEVRGADTLVARYINAHLRLSMNGTRLPLVFQEREMVADRVICVLAVPNITSCDGLTVDCDLLEDLYPDQQTEVRVETAEGSEYYTFSVGTGPYTFGMGDR